MLKKMQYSISNEQLIKLSKPARYTGGEVNAVSKTITEGTIRFAFCFPDVYEMGMSNLGLQLLYFLINKRSDTYCERAFMPWPDMIDLLNKTDTPLFAIETGDPLSKFDFLGFTLQYEMSYTNVLAMLDLAKIPLRRDQRNDSHPIICAGGPCATNPEPMADFVDFFYIGDGEAGLDLILDKYDKTKQEFLESIANIEGIYVPSLYDVTYAKNGLIESFKPKSKIAPPKVKRGFLPELNYFPEAFITPLTESVHDRAVLEIARGCIHGCRFCQAGFIYRPMRERNINDLLTQAKNLINSTGYSEISLLSLSACDHTNFTELVDRLLEDMPRVNISLPSTRLDAVSLSTLSKTQTLRKTSLTVAPEAGSQRLRDLINKNLTEEEILSGCLRAYKAGFDKIKLYFMSGLPFETPEDTAAISTLSEKIVEAYYSLPLESRKRPVNISISTSCFVPKPFTPFQWASQISSDEFINSQKHLKSSIKNKRITYRYHDAKTAQIEGMLARGDRRLSNVIETAYKNGAIFDGWSEYFKPEIWVAALEENNVDPHFYTTRERLTDEILPWDFIDMGVSKKFLVREWENAKKGVKTPNCRDGCGGCHQCRR